MKEAENYKNLKGSNESGVINVQFTAFKKVDEFNFFYLSMQEILQVAPMKVS